MAPQTNKYGFILLSNELGPNSQAKLRETVEKIKESLLR